jgi:lysozyme family protein
MKENFETCFKGMLKSEGGFVNHPKDPGGMTNLGVTKRVWESWVKREVTEKEMRDLKPNDVRDLYKTFYWDPCRCDELSWGVDYSVFDFAVNAGVKRSIITLQRGIGVKDDGIFGPATMKVVQEKDPINLIGGYFNARITFYKQLKNYETFGKGWDRRAAHVLVDSKRMHEKHLEKSSTDSEPSLSQ